MDTTGSLRWKTFWQLTEKNGRPVETRTPDLYRVNVDLSLINRGKTGYGIARSEASDASGESYAA